MSKDLTPGYGQFLVYETEDGQVKIDVRLEDETVWLTQQHMVELFQSSQQNEPVEKPLCEMVLLPAE
jgi:hypothetical protein